VADVIKIPVASSGFIYFGMLPLLRKERSKTRRDKQESQSRRAPGAPLYILSSGRSILPQGGPGITQGV
jgi:hypothetical protein